MVRIRRIARNSDGNRKEVRPDEMKWLCLFLPVLCALGGRFVSAPTPPAPAPKQTAGIVACETARESIDE